MKALFLYANCMMDNLIPVGSSAIIGTLHAAGVEVELFDTTFYRTEERPADFDRVDNLQVAPFDYESLGVRVKDEDVFVEFRAALERFRPDILMISMVESTFEQGLSLLEAAGELRPFTLAGGVLSILSPETVIKSDLVDAVCIGEGENCIAELCRRWQAGEECRDIPGLWFKNDGAVTRNPLGPMVDLNGTPFLDFSLFPKERFYKPMQGKIFRMAPIEFSRGCPYRCSYCANHALEEAFKPAGKWYRWKSMDRIFAEIEEYVTRYQVEFFYFVSESFLSMPAPQFEEFCRRYEKYRIPFWFNTRPETLTREKVRRLEEIGCFRVGIGLEHGNREFRAKMLNRNGSNESIVKACRLVEDSSIGYSINNIIGFPGETRELVFDTIRLNRQIKPNSVGTFVF
jgi:radical SAM superfamily enzyme YgiQ (UPF0313 family)